MFRWGLVGTSFITDVMARAIGEDRGAVVSAVVGRRPEAIAAFRAAHPDCAAFTSLEAMLEQADVDAVYVAWPTHLHREAVTLAAQAGKAVLCEKSLTVTMQDADDALRAVREAGVFLMEGLMYLTHPLTAAVLDALPELGRVRSVTGAYRADIARFVNPGSGGAIFNLGCYPASLAQLVLGDALGGATLQAFGNCSPDGNVGDTAALLHLTDGTLVQLHAAETYGAEDAVFTVTGERGALHAVTNPWMPLAGRNTFEVRTGAGSGGGTVRTVTVDAPLDAYATQVRLVRECVQAGRVQAERPAPRPQDSRDLMALLTAWHRSARTGERVTLP